MEIKDYSRQPWYMPNEQLDEGVEKGIRTDLTVVSPSDLLPTLSLDDEGDGPATVGESVAAMEDALKAANDRQYRFSDQLVEFAASAQYWYGRFQTEQERLRQALQIRQGDLDELDRLRSDNRSLFRGNGETRQKNLRLESRMKTYRLWAYVFFLSTLLAHFLG